MNIHQCMAKGNAMRKWTPLALIGVPASSSNRKDLLYYRKTKNMMTNLKA